MNQTPAPGKSPLDKVIFFFMVLFILSLSNSIFINQLGFYSCLLLLIARFYITKENPFSKTGLEFIFIWFIAAEILSALLSDYTSAAFVNVFKRSLLFGTIYVILASSFYLSRTKIYFKAYIIGSVITCIIYLYHSYSYFTNNLFGRTESGPSVFQNTITASEIASFLVVFLFAFLVNEKTTWRNKLLIFLGFLISSAALYATYKRTGWLGTAFGLLVILLLKKQWKILIPVSAALLIYLFMQKETSFLNSFYLNEKAEKQLTIETDGRASDVLPDDSYLMAADYSNGVVLYKDSIQAGKLETPSPVLSLSKWGQDLFIASLVDSRFLIFRRNHEELELINEFVSAGRTTSYTIRNGLLYVMDSDSGLTIFKDPKYPESLERFPHIKSTYVYADTSFLVTYLPGYGIGLYKMNSGIPSNEIPGLNTSQDFLSMFYAEDKIYTADVKGIKLFSLDRDKGIAALDSSPAAQVFLYWRYEEGRLFTMSNRGYLMELEFPADKINIINKWELGEKAGSFAFKDGKIYTSANETSRLLSFIDPSHPTNITRINLWKTGLRIFKDYPIFGVGDIGLEYYHKKYRGYYEKEVHGHLHNNFMHILATLGLFGLLAVIFMFVKIILIDLKIYKYLKDVPFASSYSLGALGSFVAFLFSGLTEFNFGDHEILTLVLFIFGLNLAFYKNHLSVHSSEYENGNL